MVGFELRDDQIETAPLGANARLWGAKSTQDAEPTSFGRESIGNYVLSLLQNIATSASAADLETGTIPTERLPAAIQGIVDMPTPKIGDLMSWDGGKWLGLEAGEVNYVLTSQGPQTAPIWSAAGQGDMLKQDNLSGLGSNSEARENLGLEIGADVQAWSAGLDDLAGLAPDNGAIAIGNGSNWIGQSGDTARASLGLAIGTNVQAYTDILAGTNASFTTTLKDKLDGIEASADVTDATNVAAAGAVMDGDFSSDGMMARTASGTYASRTVTAGTGIGVSNGSGQGGNPTIALSSGAQASLALADSAVQPAAIIDVARKSSAADILRAEEGFAAHAKSRTAVIFDYAQTLLDCGSIADLATLTRASDATYVDRDRLVKSAGSNVLRFTHDPVTGVPRGLLAEGGATNLLLRSQDFDNASWAKSNASITPAAAVAPDGTTTACLLLDNSNSGAHSISQSITYVSGTTYVLSGWAKAYAGTGSRYAFLRFNGPTTGFSSTRGLIVDLATGAPVHAANLVGYAIERFPDGWYRISIVATADSSGTSTALQFGVTTQSAVTGVPYTGDGTSGAYFWGAQLEIGSSPTSYIPTTSATVTRSADSLVVGPDTFPVQASGECTLYWRGRIRGLRSSGEAGLLTASDGTSDEVVSIREGASGVDVAVTDGGSGVADTSAQAITLGNDYAFAVSVRANDLKFYANGAQIATDSSLTLPTIDRLAISPGAGSIYEIDEIAYIARALTAGELAVLTAV